MVNKTDTMIMPMLAQTSSTFGIRPMSGTLGITNSGWSRGGKFLLR
jgi:hypothetical protein